MKILFDTIKLLFVAMFVGIQWVSNPVPALAQQYLRGLLQLTRVAIILPIPVAGIGIVMGWPWLTACAGLWCTLFLLILFIWGAPLGVLVESLLKITDTGLVGILRKTWNSLRGKNTDSWISGEQYLQLARGILLWEAVSYMLLSIIPLRNHWEWVPLTALLVTCLILMNYHWKIPDTWLRPMFWYGGIALLALLIIGFFFPEQLTVKSMLDWQQTDAWKTSPRVMSTIILAGLAIGVGIILLCRKFFLTRSQTSITTTVGGSGSSKGSGFAGFLCIVLLIGIVSLIVRENLNGKGQMERDRPTGTALPRSNVYPVTVNVWTPVVIGERIDAIWHAPKGYFFRYNSELMEYEDEPNISIKMAVRRGPYTVYFRAKEVPTVVSVYQTAIP